VDALDRFLDDLASARIGTTFNQYRDADAAFDCPGAAKIRLGNLAAYLRARPHPSLMLVGEAAGYAGCRFSGIAFTSERCLPRDRWTSVDDPNGHVAHSASIVHRVLRELDLEADTVLWKVAETLVVIDEVVSAVRFRRLYDRSASKATTTSAVMIYENKATAQADECSAISKELRLSLGLPPVPIT